VITHPGLFGTNPWLDKDRQVIGVMLVQTYFLRVVPLVHDIQAQVKAMIPVQDQAQRKPPVAGVH
jgi:hypothetical protein